MSGIRDKVAIVGTGHTKFGENFEMTYGDMLVEAAFEAMEGAGLGPDDIEAVWLSTAVPEADGGQGVAGVAVADHLGITGRPVTRCSNYCASGMDAFRNAVFAVAAGVYDRVLVVGCEKMRDVGPRESLVKMVADSGHPVWGKGMSAPAMFAMHATRYMDAFGYGRETLAQVAVKNHAHGAKNPRAHFRSPVTADKVLRAPEIARPLGLYDCCPTTDGAAALVLTRADLASRHEAAVLVRAVSLMVGSGDNVFFDPGHDFLGFKSTRQAAADAYRQAGVTDPARELDLCEVHDCFTITELLNYEDLGLCGRGEGGRLVEEGRTALGGDIPVNPSGGLKSCGHPIGATGLRMLVELTYHLLGQAGERQVPGARLGLAHNLGGAGSIASVAILAQA